MRAIGIADLRRNLGRVLRQARSGERVVIMSRNERIAELVPYRPVGPAVDPISARLAIFAQRGLLSLPQRRLTALPVAKKRLRGSPGAAAIVKDRESPR